MAEDFKTLVGKASSGDPSAGNRLYLLAFPRLRTIASRLLRRERPGHTLQPTALVSELFLKLRRLETQVTGDEHFFRLAARAMRQVLIDHGRAHGLRKTLTAESLVEVLRDSAAGGLDRDREVEVRDVLNRLRRADPCGAEAIWLRAVEGRTWEEVSAALGREIWRVRDDYDFAVQWMAARLRAAESPARSPKARPQAAASAGRRDGSGS